jgi:hypothetical protein
MAKRIEGVQPFMINITAHSDWSGDVSCCDSFKNAKSYPSMCLTACLILLITVFECAMYGMEFLIFVCF